MINHELFTSLGKSFENLNSNLSGYILQYISQKNTLYFLAGHSTWYSQLCFKPLSEMNSGGAGRGGGIYQRCCLL